MSVLDLFRETAKDFEEIVDIRRSHELRPGYVDPEPARPGAQAFLRTYLFSGYPLRKPLNSVIENPGLP